MLTALHITLPKRRGNIYNDDGQHLPNRCLVVNDATNDVRLISTEAALKYMDNKDSSYSQHERQTGVQFRFGHIAVSPHHGSIFVKQVAPMLHDLCRTFLSYNTQTTAHEKWERTNLSKPDPKSMTQLMNRTVFIYGSQSATERRTLFLHLAKAVAQALMQQTGNSTSATSSVDPSCEVSFSLVDLYHGWGVGDVLDNQAAMHDGARLEKAQRKQPRWSRNEPKGIAFVEPTRQLIAKRDNATTALLRALQRTDAPRGLRTEAEKEDHETKSMLVLTFYLSLKGTAASRSTCGPLSGSSQREFFDDCRHSHVRYCEQWTEAKVHLILLPDSAAAAHGKQVAQELGAIASALRACTKWFTEEENKVKSEDVSADTMLKATHRPSSSSSNPVRLWAPLRESPLLLYVFESTLYYARQRERSRRHQLKQQRYFNGSCDMSRSRSVSPNASISSTSRHGSAQGASLGNMSTGDSAPVNQWLSAAVDAVECIVSGIGQSLLIVCVNSGWDQYYQARSAFLFAQRATNQPDVHVNKGAIIHVNDKLCEQGNNSNNNNNNNPISAYIDPNAVYTHTTKTKGEETKWIPSNFKSSEDSNNLRSLLHIPSGSTPDMSSPRWKDRTQPRHGSPPPSNGYYVEVRNDDSTGSFAHSMLSDVPLRNEGDDMGGNDSNGNGSNDPFGSIEDTLDLLHITSSLVSCETHEELQQDNPHTSRPQERTHPHDSDFNASAQQLFSQNSKHQSVEEPPQGSQQPQEEIHHHQQQQQQQHFPQRDHPGPQQLSPVRGHVPSMEQSAGRGDRFLHPYAPLDDENDGVAQLENRARVQSALSPPQIRRVQQMTPNFQQLSIQPFARPLPLSSGVGVVTTKTTTIDDESSSEESLRSVLRNNAKMREENERFRAMFALMSSREADAWKEEAMRGVGVTEVCNAELLSARSAACTAELKALREELAAVTKRAWLLEKSLTRSVEDNRKIRRTISRKLQQSLEELPRVLRDVMQQCGRSSPAVGEERIQRWEELLKATVECMSQVVQRPGRGPVHGALMDSEEEGEEEEEEEEQAYGADGKEEEETVLLANKKYVRKRNTPMNHAVRSVRTSGNAIRTSGEEKDFRKKISRATQSEAFMGPVSPPLNIDPRIVELLRIAHHLFLLQRDVPNNNTRLESMHGTIPKLTTGGSFSESVMHIFSPDSKEQVQRVEQGVVDDDFRINKKSRNNATYERFLRLLSSLSNEILDKECAREPPVNVCLTNVERLSKNDAKRAISHKDNMQTNVCELSSEAQHHTEINNSIAAFRLTMQRLEFELECEREKRRQVQDELLRLRLRLGEYESKLAFIDETVKPKISKDIAELEQADNERKARQAAERQQRAAIMSEIRKRLEDVAAKTELDIQPSPRTTRLI